MPKISDFRPQQRNANRHTQRGLGMLDKSMADNGFIGAMTSAADGEIFDGSARLETAYDRFGEEVEPIVVDADGTRPIIVRRVDIPSASDPKAKKLAIAANRIAQVDLDWDPEVLAAVNQEIDIGDLFFENELEDIFKTIEEDLDKEIGKTDPDDIPDEEQVETRVKRGEVWQLGRHRIMCGDSTCKADVEKLMDGTIADMMLTDPPYGVSYADKNEYLNKLDEGNRNQSPIQNDHLSIEETAESLWYPAFSNAFNSLADVSCFYCFMPQGGDQMMMMMMMSKSGLIPRHELIWLKNNHVLGRTDYAYKHEPIIYGWKRNGTHKYYGGFHTSIFEFSKPLKSELHPTMKPIELLSQIIDNSSLSNQIILDFFLGSGSTLIACEKTDRTCYGMEISEKYCGVIS